MNITGEPSIDIPKDVLSFAIHLFHEGINKIKAGSSPIGSCIVLSRPGGSKRIELAIIPVVFEDDDAKNQFRRNLFEFCDEQNAFLAVFVLDLWLARSDDPDYLSKMRPMDDPNRIEALAVIIMEPSGKTNILPAVYRRNGDEIEFEPEICWRDRYDAFSRGFLIPPWRPTKETIQ